MLGRRLSSALRGSGVRGATSSASAASRRLLSTHQQQPPPPPPQQQLPPQWGAGGGGGGGGAGAGGGTTGAHAWLGLGQPLAWWLLGAYGVGGLAVNSWELSSAEFDRLCSRGGTGAWGADTQFQSLQELLDWAEYGSVVSHVEVSSSWLVVIIYVVVET